MSDSSLYSDYIMTRQRVDQLERIERAGTYLTLRRTTTQSITTAGTIVSWEDAVRNVGFTWSAGTTISIPQSGYYILDLVWSFSSNTGTSVDLLVGGVATARMVNSSGGGQSFRAIAMRYFTTSDSVEVRINVAAGRTMQVIAYGSLDESPFLHIARVA